MKILLAVVMTLSVSSSVWAATCPTGDEATPCQQCQANGDNWKPKAELAAGETVQCVKVAVAAAKENVCNTNSGKLGDRKNGTTPEAKPGAVEVGGLKK